MINDKDMNMFSKLNIEYFNLVREFRNFVLRYNVSHDHITESVLNDIVKKPIEYILHRRQSNYETESETDSHDDESDDDNNNLQLMINNISREKSISENLKQLFNNSLLKHTIINKILKDSSINNKELLINNIMNEKTINNNEIINNEKNNTFIETPKCIKFKKAVLNPKSNDTKSFQYSITLSLYQKEIGNSFNRITKIKPYINNFNWNNINFPPNNQDYEILK